MSVVASNHCEPVTRKRSSSVGDSAAQEDVSACVSFIIKMVTDVDTTVVSLHVDKYRH